MTPTTRAAANVAEAAKEAGVGRIVYLGGFVPEEGDLSEHLTSRAEVAAALSIQGGPEVVWLGAAMIIGAGSTSFEMLRYVGDRFCRDSDAGVDEQPDGPDLHQRCSLLPRDRRRCRPGACGRLRHLRPGNHYIPRSVARIWPRDGQVAG